MQGEAGIEGGVLEQDAVQISVGRGALREPEGPGAVEALSQTIKALERRLRGYESRQEELDRRVMDLQALKQAARGFARLRDHRAILQGLLKICARRTGCGFALGLLWDGERGCMKRLAVEGEVQSGLEFAVDPRGAFWGLLVQGEAFSTRDAVAVDGTSAVPLSLALTGAQAWLPLTLEEEVLGLVALGERAEPWLRRPQEVDFLSFLAQQASTAINTALLHARYCQQVDEISRHMSNLRALYEINDAVNTSQDIDDLLEVILAQAVETVGARRGSVLLWDEGQEQLSVQASYGAVVGAQDACARSFLRGEGVAGQVFQSGEARLVSCAAQEPDFVGEVRDVGAMICAPLRVEGEVLGVLSLARGSEEGAFSASELPMVSALANQAALAIYKTRLHELATRDGLTRMLTRRFFMRRFADELKRARRFERPMSVLLVDVDRFKQINDTRGHLVGDAVLQAVSAVLRANIRDEIDVLGRYGGDEFALILPETDLEGARAVASRLLERVRGLQVGQGVEGGVTLSIGVSCWPQHGGDAEALIQSADEALYLVKRRGRDGVATQDEVEGSAPARG
jgi:diguanylate cyclase (GGDEF)-like protein